MKPTFLPYQSDFLKTIGEVRELLIVVAMDAEEKALLSGAQYSENKIGTRTTVTLKQLDFSKCRVRVARSGVGLVNAGILLTLIAEYAKIDAVILLGVGGALDASLKIGDVVVSKQILQHDSISSQEWGSLLIAPGELTLQLPADQQVDPVMRCDSVLVDWVTKAVEQSHIGNVLQGTLVSGSEFAASSERKRFLRGLANDALLVDMEAAAFAQVARKLRLPFVAAKTVADRANPSTSVSKDYIQFLQAAADHSSDLLKSLLATFT